jgi:SAM-dependent methyltransferase
VRADATRLPFRDGSADVVVEVHVLHLVPAWREALQELHRVLAPGGTYLLGRGGGHAEDPESPRNATSRRMRELIGEGPSSRVGAQDDDQKLEALRALGGTVEPLEPVAWETHETWADALAEIEGRMFSHSWSYPERTWADAARRLRVEVEADHPDLVEPVPVASLFRLSAVRF